MADSPQAETNFNLLRAWSEGDEEALSALVPRVHRELRRLAGHFLQKERAGLSLQATDLVQEVYVRLVNASKLDWQAPSPFLRRFRYHDALEFLLDRARRRCAAKREWKPEEADLAKAVDMCSKRSHELVALDDALTELAKVDPRKARIVELRFLGGLEVKETAEVVGVSPETVMRDWKLARAWLLWELRR